MSVLDKASAYKHLQESSEDGRFLFHTACSKCDSSDGLAVYEKEDEEGGTYRDGYCWACQSWFAPDKLGEHKQMSEVTQKKETKTNGLTVEEVSQLSTVGSRKRGIRKEFMEMYGIKMQHQEDGRVTHHYYPVTKQGKLTGYQTRKLPKDFGGTQVGDTKTKDADLFGQSVFESGKVQVAKKWLLITEGQLDAVALQQVIWAKGNPTYRNAVVSINSGAANAVKSIQQNWKWVNTFEQVILFFDQDDPGKKAALEVAKKMPLGKCKIAKFSEKDPCDMLAKGKDDELYNAMWKAETYAPDGVLAGTGLWNLITTPLAQSDAHYPWKGLDKMLHGIRPAELVTLTAGCVDADTEFFTGHGWKRIADYQEGDQVAAYKEDGSIVLEVPEKFHKYPAESLWHIKTKYGVDQVLSDEHKVVYISEEGKLNEKPFVEVRSTHEENKGGFRGRFLTTFGSVGADGVPLTEEEIRLQVAVMADGYFRSESTNYVTVRIKKERKKQRLVKLLEQAGVSYKRKEVAPYGGFETFRFNAPLRMKTFEKYWYDCSDHQLAVICDEVFHWDGCEGDTYFSADKEDVDFLQYAFATQGKRSTVLIDDRESRQAVNPCYRLSVAGNKTVGIRGKTEKTPVVEYKTKDGFKYCFTTSTGKWVMRRNFRIAVTGNSGVAKSTFARMIAHHLQKTTDDNIGMIFLEESVKKTSLQLMSLEAGKQFHLPETEYTEEEQKRAFDNTLGTGQYYFFDDFASQDFEAISEAILYMARAANCKYIFLDHISMLVSGGEYGDERKALDAICTKLRALVQQLDITLFAITHLKRPQGEGHEEGAKTSLAQLRGSAGIAQLSDIVIGFERNSQAEDEKERNTTHVRVLKNRFSGEVSLACSLFYDKDTGWAKELSQEEADAMDTSFSEMIDLEEGSDFKEDY